MVVGPFNREEKSVAGYASRRPEMCAFFAAADGFRRPENVVFSDKATARDGRSVSWSIMAEILIRETRSNVSTIIGRYLSVYAIEGTAESP